MTSTIAAISTPPGVGGIAVLRLSGPEAVAIATRHCRVAETPQQALFTLFRDGEEVIDEVVVTRFRAPHSYTGEETVEISCHGSLYVQEAILNALLASGARLAEPGEFTRRAFLNGKLDLSQAEAVADLIDSTNAAQHRLAVSQLRGGYAQKLRELRTQLVELTSLLELELDFSQEDVEFVSRDRLTRLVEEISLSVEALRQSFRMGNALKRGIPVAIIGRPNAGKSSLLNALLHDDRAIVSPVPGTTRDTIEETFVIGGTPYRIIDTAGLRESADEVERLGIERSRKAAEEADIILYVHDATQPDSQIAEDLQHLPLADKHLIVVYNKVDLLETAAASCSPKLGEPKVDDLVESTAALLTEECVRISAKTGTGLDALTAILNPQNSQFSILNSQFSILSNLRHLEALTHVQEALAHVSQGLADGLPADLVAIDLRDALHHLGTITGEVVTDEILGTIFSRFCVGK